MTLEGIIFDWDPQKCQQNIEKHGLDFKQVEFIDWTTEFSFQDDRQNYGETRWITLAYLAQRLVYMVTVIRLPKTLRIISLRKANAREQTIYQRRTGTS